MATVTLQKAFNFSTVRGWWDDPFSYTVYADSATKLSVGVGGEKLILNGTSFTYSGGFLSGGKVSSIEYQTGGSTAYKVTGLSTHNNSAGTLIDMAVYGSTQDVYSYVFSGKDKFIGSSGNDTLNGYAGIDDIYGKGGKDLLIGGSGKDHFCFDTTLNSTTNIDTIKDFKAVDDSMYLDNAIFKKLGATGALNSAFFKANITGKAADGNDFIVYETDTGKLFYDADGSGSGKAVQFALIGTSAHATLTAADFSVI